MLSEWRDPIETGLSPWNNYQDGAVLEANPPVHRTKAKRKQDVNNGTEPVISNVSVHVHEWTLSQDPTLCEKACVASNRLEHHPFLDNHIAIPLRVNAKPWIKIKCTQTLHNHQVLIHMSQLGIEDENSEIQFLQPAESLTLLLLHSHSSGTLLPVSPPPP